LNYQPRVTNLAGYLFASPLTLRWHETMNPSTHKSKTFTGNKNTRKPAISHYIYDKNW